ncbi:hypothetical protein FACS189419_06770 [Planctomycetales bacterium]|nr:hypothetical protein FACS189419_06770 [Planctomycetales bacterium]
MNANEFSYGIEIESLVSNETVAREHLNIGRYHNGNQVPYLPQGWKAEHDSSIRVTAGHTDCEIISPILKGEEGIKQVIEVLRILKEKSHTVNESTAIHIHTFFDPEWGSDKLARLITVASYLEKGIFATTGTKKRERGTYCNAIRKYGNNKEAKNIMGSRRYHFLNITNLANHSKNTVEFRAFSGSLNEVKIVGWIQLCIAIVEKAIDTKRLPKWSPKQPKCFWAKDGKGQTELGRLLSYIGWQTGYARNLAGKQYGWITDIIPQDEIKKEFRRLAKKYDSEE